MYAYVESCRLQQWEMSMEEQLKLINRESSEGMFFRGDEKQKMIAIKFENVLVFQLKIVCSCLQTYAHAAYSWEQICQINFNLFE